MKAMPESAIARKVLMVLAVAPVMIVLLLFSKFSPGAKEIRSTRSRIADLRKQIEFLSLEEIPRVGGDLVLAGDISASWRALKDRHESLLAQIPENSEAGKLLDEISEISMQSGVDIVSLSTGEKIDGKDHAILPISVSIRCRYEGLERFIRRIEVTGRLLRVEFLDIRSDGMMPPAITAEFHINGFIRPPAGTGGE